MPRMPSMHELCRLGVCQCGSLEFYNGTASLGNGYCEPYRKYNKSCSATSNCDYRMNLVCSSGICTCATGYNYDATYVVSASVTGYCTKAASYLENCTVALKCSTSQNLYCNNTGPTTGICLCNTSTSFWDGTTCASKLTIGGVCTSSSECNSADNLFCSNYTQSLGTCDCDKYNFWNYTCINKQLFNTSCTSSYVCDDNRGLFCQGSGGALFQKCDCFNISYTWDSLYVTNKSKTCVRKLVYNQSTCFGDLDCEDYNYLVCYNGTCKCQYFDYFDSRIHSVEKCEKMDCAFFSI